MRIRHGIRVACVLALACIAAAGDEAPPAGRDKIMRRFIEEFVTLTPGEGKFPATFRLGSPGDADASEKPQVKVAFPKGASFAVAKYEVTQELYEAVMGRNPSKWKGQRNSVEMVNWDDANDFCHKLSLELRKSKLLAEGEVIRLPSEAEWEYACRAGTTTRYSFGDNAADLGDYGWFTGNAKGEDPPVGRKKPNAWGLYDMHGYVWEWGADTWAATPEGAPADGSPRADKGVKERVLRGGSWSDGAERCGSASRRRAAADLRSDAVGFRCVRASAPKAPKEDR